ncbi:hypothetical protein KI655_18585 [Vibrio sp. D404a]|uniref:hypothetical protein n=1 Tax=unclassified Vibrio TaxID=2614977 RepID=UPI0025549AF3|nr:MULTISPECIES: hypothetical protein [unclassified Vibrio]MDK9739306.1 hypothetical protein [Vibrio sp. D404a]MDK9797658.1 hypothetical protein [Vibrio sp. D449a]
MNHFYNKKGARIKKEAWKQLRKKDSYSIVRQYCNDDIMISAEWTGEPDSRTAPDDRKLFTIFVHNNVNGSWIKDVSLTNTFRSEEAMDVAFEDLLLRFTDSELDEEEGVIEKGNMLEPERKRLLDRSMKMSHLRMKRQYPLRRLAFQVLVPGLNEMAVHWHFH